MPTPRRNKTVIASLVALLGLGSGGTWIARHAHGWFGNTAHEQGSQRVNINACTLTELEDIPGIGEAIAKLIVAHRPYTSVDQLQEVSGIGPKSLEKLRPYVKVEGKTEKLR